jgi:hypothetical protein
MNPIIFVEDFNIFSRLAILERKFLKGKTGDRINALMSAIGYNFCKLLGLLPVLWF